MEPIPGGFPSAERTAKAGQVRVTSSALDKIEADPANVIGGFAGSNTNGVITFAIPASCSGTAICCPNGQVSTNCGPITIDLVKQVGDLDRLSLAPASVASPNGRLDVTMRARVKTVNDLIVTISGQDCKVHLDTTVDGSADLVFSTQVALTQNGTSGTTRIAGSNTSVALEDDDYSISGLSGGDFLCGLGDIIPKSLVEDQIAGLIEDQINAATCKACPGGTVAECGSPFATKCTDNVCEMADGSCYQELGIDGRIRGSVAFASLSPGTTGALDIYEVAGGYSTTNNAGLSLGLLGGMQPGGSPRDLCGPPATAPAPVTIPTSNFFQGNTRPDTTDAFDVGFGLHKSQLDQLAWAGYQGGLFCLTVGSSTVAQLSTDTISLLSRSLGTLVESNSPMAVGLRPQKPPVLTLGKNTFKDDGSGTMVPDQPLIDITFQGLEIDFFASIDDQYNRVFTVVTDVHLPIGLQTTTMGELTPVIGTPDDAFTNITVKNNEAITESPDEIAGLFPTLLNLVLPQLSGGFSPISLPELGGLALDITDVTSVDADQFLAIFANLVPASMARVVDTTAELGGIVEPSEVTARNVKAWRTSRPTAVSLVLGGTAADLEFSWRTNAGAWSGWSTNRRPTISPSVFWLPGIHKLQVRARQVGHPETMDPTPVEIELALGTDLDLESDRPLFARADFHGQAGAAGCSCETGSASGGLFLALVFGLVLVPRRRLRGLVRDAKRLGAVVWIAALASLPGCSCGSNPCGDVDCLPGAVERGSTGRFTSIAADSKRVLVATYDQGLGDLVAVDATDPAKLTYVAVDGVPDITAVYDPETYRRGIEDPGPNVGAWTSIAMASGLGRIAYQDRDESSLKFAYETEANKWSSYVVDGSEGVTGLYASLTIDADKRPAIAYLAVGIDDTMDHRATELRLARAKDANPTQTSEWDFSVIASAPGSCGGLCGSQSCVVGEMATDPQVCVTPTTDCATACADTDVCVMGACRERIDEPKVVAPPLGTGLYVSLVTLPDGRLAAAYYDQTRRALVLAVEGTKGGNDFTETVLDGNVAGADRGIWASATAGDDGTVHIAYQDALGDQLMYTSWANGAPGTPAVVDDGQRTGDRPHPVGTGSSIYVSGGEPAIVYQDGLVSNVRLATRAGGTWTHAAIQDSPTLDGFSIGATTGHGSPVFAWGTLDPTQPVVGTLTVSAP
jgi:MYXO-CTERM domain-containing protein